MNIKKIQVFFGNAFLIVGIITIVLTFMPVPDVIINISAMICYATFISWFVIGILPMFSGFQERNKTKAKILEYAARKSLAALPYTKSIAEAIIQNGKNVRILINNEDSNEINDIGGNDIDSIDNRNFVGISANIDGKQIVFYANSPKEHNRTFDYLLKRAELIKNANQEMENLKNQLAANARAEDACKCLKAWTHKNTKQAQENVNIASKDMLLRIQSVQEDIKNQLKLN